MQQRLLLEGMPGYKFNELETLSVVKKPWGHEIWLELNDIYCYKRIYIKAGCKTSLQYHEKKLETNYIISGQAMFSFKNDQGELDNVIMIAGDSVTIRPGMIHRFSAISDLILQEVSTPEVDDVIRVEDDSNRPNGRIENEHE